MSNNGRKYNREFKLEAVKLVVEKGRSVPSVALDLGIHEKTLYKWFQTIKKIVKMHFQGADG